MNVIDELGFRNLIKNGLQYLNDPDFFDQDFDLILFDVLTTLDKLDDQQMDLYFFDYIGKMAQCTHENINHSWRWNTELIVQGKYPLQMIPNYLRQRIEEKYYLKKNESRDV